MSPFSERIERLALILLLAVMAARPFLSEIPFGSLAQSQPSAKTGETQTPALHIQIDKGELARVTFAIAILAIAAIYLTAAALSGNLKVRQPVIGALIAAFVAITLTSALYASNKRSALDSWLEQTSLLIAGFLAIQLVRTRLRFVLVVCVMAGLAATMATKGLYQYFVEGPDTVREFLTAPDSQLRALGLEPSSVQARAFINRMMDRSVIGYLGLSNIMASLLIILGLPALGLAIQKLLWAIKARQQWKQQSKAGQIHSPTLAALAAIVLAIAPLIVLLMTRSRAGIALAAIALVGAIVLMFAGEKLARHWKACAAIAAGAVCLTIAATVTYGLAKDALPGASMTFRWYYWRASADIVAQHPLLGVGPANFPAAYLAVRRPAAEEAVKTPHNFIAQSLSEYGLPAGGLFLAIVILTILKIARPVQAGQNLTVNANAPNDSHLLSYTFVAVLIITIASMLAFGSITWDWAVIFIDVFIPAAVLATMLAVIFWCARDLATQQQNLSVLHIFMGMGLVAFVLHNMVEFSMFVSAPAMVFWVALGSLIGQKVDCQEFQPPRFVRWVRPVFVWSVVIAATIVLWQPVAAKTALNEQLANVGSSAAPDSTVQKVKLACEAARADLLDPLPAMEAAKCAMAVSPQQAQQWAREAIRRDTANPSGWSLAAEMSFFVQGDDRLHPYLTMMAEAIARNPSDSRLRVRYAEMLLRANEPAKANEQLDKSIWIQSKLLPGSVEAFTPAEQTKISALRARAKPLAQ